LDFDKTASYPSVQWSGINVDEGGDRERESVENQVL